MARRYRETGGSPETPVTPRCSLSAAALSSVASRAVSPLSPGSAWPSPSEPEGL